MRRSEKAAARIVYDCSMQYETRKMPRCSAFNTHALATDSIGRGKSTKTSLYCAAAILAGRSSRDRGWGERGVLLRHLWVRVCHCSLHVLTSSCSSPTTSKTSPHRHRKPLLKSWGPKTSPGVEVLVLVLDSFVSLVLAMMLPPSNPVRALPANAAAWSRAAVATRDGHSGSLGVRTFWRTSTPPSSSWLCH